MAAAHLFSAGVDLPGQTIAPMISPSADTDHKHDLLDERDIRPGAHGEEGEMVPEQEMPEGPTVTRWEEWAYYL